MIIIKYVVETNARPFSQSFKAIASVSFVFNPKVNPTSKKLSHIIIDDNVNQIPYSSDDTYPNVSGTSINDINMLHPLIIKDPNIFFLTITERLSPDKTRLISEFILYRVVEENYIKIIRLLLSVMLDFTYYFHNHNHIHIFCRSHICHTCHISRNRSSNHFCADPYQYH